MLAALQMLFPKFPQMEILSTSQRPYFRVYYIGYETCSLRQKLFTSQPFKYVWKENWMSNLRYNKIFLQFLKNLKFFFELLILNNSRCMIMNCCAISMWEYSKTLLKHFLSHFSFVSMNVNVYV